MTDAKLVKYVQDQLKAGFSEEVIKDQLIKSGRTMADVSTAFSEATKPERVKHLEPLGAELPKAPQKSEATTVPTQQASAAEGGGFLKKYWIAVLLVAILAAGGIAGFIFLGKGNINIGGGEKSCGADQTCLANAFKSCSKASGLYTTGGSGSALIFDGTISGKSGKNCGLQVRVKSATGNFAEYNGKTMGCAVPLVKAKTIGNPLVELSKVKPHCSGSLTALVD